MTATAVSTRGRLNVGRFLLTLLIFLALGPFVGGAVMIIGIGISIGIATGDYGGMFAMIATMVIYGLWASWPMGALPALVVGLVIALADAFGRAGWKLATAIGCVAGIAVMLAGNVLNNPGIAAGFFAAALVATLVCYAATRGFVRR